MIGGAPPYVAATVTAAGLIVGGLVLVASAESPNVVLPRFPDDPELAWDIRFDEAEWAVGDDDYVYVAAPASGTETTISVWDRETGEFVRRIRTRTPVGESVAFSEILDGVLLAERCDFSDAGAECELVATDAAFGRTLWSRDTSNTGIGLVGRSVVLALARYSETGGSKLRLIDLRSGDEQASVTGGYLTYDSFRPEFTVRNGQDVKVFRLGDLDRPISSARLPSVEATYDVVGDELVVGNGRRLFVTSGDGLDELRTFPANIESVQAASDELVLIRTSDGLRTAVDVSPEGSHAGMWTSEAEVVDGVVGSSGSAVLAFDGDFATVTFLDLRNGDAVAESENGCCRLADGGVVLVESERVWGFGYAEQDLVWSVDGLTVDSTFHLVDGGFVTIETDGTVRLYQ